MLKQGQSTGHSQPSRRQFLKAAVGLPVAMAAPAGIASITPGSSRPTEQTDTPRIQRAIDQISKSGGGTVYLPAGRYISGTLQLRSRVTLWLGNGATLVMSKNSAEFLPPERLAYDPKANFATSNFRVALIVGDGLEHVSIIGDGEIDCEYTKSGGPKPIALRRCSNVLVRDITIRNAPSYNISLLGCDFVTIDNVTIRNGLSDGIDPDCCRHVRISNCFVESYDDTIVLKASGALGERRATEYVTVDNCILRTASCYFKCGTESCGNFRQIAISNCVFEGGVGMRHGNPGLAFYTVDGGELSNISASNIVMNRVGTPFTVLRGNRDRCGFGAGPGSVTSIRISDIVATEAKLPSVIAGLPDAPVVGVSIQGIQVTLAGKIKGTSSISDIPEHPGSYPEPVMFGPLPAHGIFLRHVSDVSIRQFTVEATEDERLPIIVADDTVNLKLASVETSAQSKPTFWLHNNRNSSVELAETNFCRISGSRSADLRFPSATSAAIHNRVEISADVKAGSIQHTTQ
ncbi:glycoside hydrolase family 28 protein [Edaphobacter albus]|uniref:glycoside hydrolase family 28 protein n=1 Tax=Edaphobacter sp. 4G125 TaxID=2763071 RepID=UPI001647A210|nr:glycosyl hydrolase family 28 protein [Edaphobacter sp. 4G125]QNI37467.1 right-handed parallel beta-helix repeat-containing protein [Edaphobacter sp. 4G125]